MWISFYFYHYGGLNAHCCLGWYMLLAKIFESSFIAFLPRKTRTSFSVNHATTCNVFQHVAAFYHWNLEFHAVSRNMLLRAFQIFYSCIFWQFRPAWLSKFLFSVKPRTEMIISRMSKIFRMLDEEWFSHSFSNRRLNIIACCCKCYEARGK